MRGASRATVVVGTALALGVLAVLALGVLATPAQAAEPEPVRTSGYLEAPDGVRLKWTLLRPSEEGRFPTMVQYEGYSAGDHPDNDVPELVERMLAKGVAVFGLSVRGTACSGGGFDLFEPQWGRDGAAAVEWIARQPWSNGKVAMFGFSFAGIMQLLTAGERPPHLVAIAPGAVVTDLYRDVAHPGGLFNQFFATLFTVVQKWGNGTPSSVDQTAGGDLECGENNATRRDEEHLIVKETRETPFIDDRDYYAPRSAERVLDKIEVPVLSVASWQDEQTGVRGSYSLLEHLPRERLWMVLANGFHSNYSQSPPYQQLVERFLTHHLLGAPNGWERTPHVQVWHELSAPERRPRWVTELPAWPPPTRAVRLRLRTGGLLSPQPPPAGEPPDSYDYPLPSPSVPLGPFIPSPQIPPEGSAETSFGAPVPPGGAVTFTTPALRRDIEVLGPASADLWLRSTARDTDLQVTLTEVRPDGSEQYVQRGWLRASHRRLDPRRSTPTRPLPTHRRADARPLEPGVAELARVEIWPVGHVFRKGSSVRMTIDAPTGMTGFFGYDFLADPAVNTILHDAAHPSALVLAVLPGAAALAARPPCDGFDQAPCRENREAVPAGALDIVADDELGLPAATRCVRRARLTIRLRPQPAARIVRARVSIAGRPTRVFAGRPLRRIVLRRLPRGAVQIRVVARTKRGKRLESVRVYRTCSSTATGATGAAS